MTLGMGLTLQEPQLSQKGLAHWKLLCCGPPWGQGGGGGLPPLSAQWGMARPHPG